MTTTSQPSPTLDDASAKRMIDENYEQPRYSKRDTLLTMSGVLLVMLLASLDQTSTVY